MVIGRLYAVFLNSQRLFGIAIVRLAREVHVAYWILEMVRK